MGDLVGTSTATEESKAGDQPTIDASRMPLMQHLSELAQRIKKCLFAFIIAVVIASAAPDPLHPFGGPHAFYGYNFFVTDMIRYAETTYARGYTIFPVSPTDPVFAYINVSMILALVGSMPYIFYQLYGFIAPGLYLREKRTIRKYLLPFTVLLIIGEVTGVLVIFPVVMRMLLLFYGPTGTAAFISIDSFINLLLIIPLITALGFTFPVFVIPLVELKIIKAKQLSGIRKWIYICVPLVVSIANPDPTDISSIPIILPILILYEITILLAKRVEKNRLKKEQLREEQQSSMNVLTK